MSEGSGAATPQRCHFCRWTIAIGCISHLSFIDVAQA
jgi:hypothetical protein